MNSEKFAIENKSKLISLPFYENKIILYNGKLQIQKEGLPFGAASTAVFSEITLKVISLTIIFSVVMKCNIPIYSGFLNGNSIFYN